MELTLDFSCTWVSILSEGLFSFWKSTLTLTSFEMEFCGINLFVLMYG